MTNGTRRGWGVSVTPRPLFTPGERLGTHCTGDWVGPQGRYGDRCGKKSRPPPGFDPRTVHPVASRYTDWATRPTHLGIILVNKQLDAQFFLNKNCASSWLFTKIVVSLFFFFLLYSLLISQLLTLHSFDKMVIMIVGAIRFLKQRAWPILVYHAYIDSEINPLNAELNPICNLLALLAQHFLHVSRIRVKSLTLKLLMSYIYIYIYIYDISSLRVNLPVWTARGLRI